jgi:hypothetical protein
MSEENTNQPITQELFDHLVGLAALELSPQEAEYLRKELNNQLMACLTHNKPPQRGAQMNGLPVQIRRTSLFRLLKSKMGTWSFPISPIQN